MKDQRSHLKLSETEKKQMTNIFFDLSYSPYTHYAEFERQAILRFYNTVPKAILEKLLELKNPLNSVDHILFTNFPTDESLMPTPTEYLDFDLSVKKKFVSEACGIGLASVLGDVFGYINEKGGQLIHNNYPIINTKRKISNEYSDDILPFHNENIHLDPMHPDFIILYCLRGCRENKAETYLLHTSDILKYLNPHSVEILSKSHFYTTPPESFYKVADGSGRTMPVLSFINGKLIIKIEFTDTKAITKIGEKHLLELKKRCENSKDIVSIKLNPGDVLIFNNHFNIHSRSTHPSFFDGKDRWLQRIFIKNGLSFLQLKMIESPYFKVLNL